MTTKNISPQKHRDTEKADCGAKTASTLRPAVILLSDALRASVPLWLKVFVCALAASMLAACGGGPKVPDWKKDSINLIEKYKKAELKGEVQRAERYFEQALEAAGSAGKIGETAQLHLIRCATRQASLDYEPCTGYLDHAKFGVNPEDEAYYRFLTNQQDKLDTSKLPAQYRDFARISDPAKIVASLRSISDPLSRLIAASLATARKQTDDAILNLAAETASEQGWRKPLLVYLKLLENRATVRNDEFEAEKLRTRIKLVEESIM